MECPNRSTSWRLAPLMLPATQPTSISNQLKLRSSRSLRQWVLILLDKLSPPCNQSKWIITTKSRMRNRMTDLALLLSRLKSQSNKSKQMARLQSKSSILVKDRVQMVSTWTMKMSLTLEMKVRIKESWSVSDSNEGKATEKGQINQKTKQPRSLRQELRAHLRQARRCKAMEKSMR